MTTHVGAVNRGEAIARIENALGHRRLIWVGTRGTDAQPLLSISQFDGIIGLISPLGVPSWDEGQEAYLERLSRERVDLNAYSVDADRTEGRRKLTAQLRSAMQPGTVAIAYRPSGFLASAYFTRSENASYLGMFHGAQASFEHKPWVETELAKRGVPTIPWRYFADDERTVLDEWMGDRRFVLRANYSDGGRGLQMAEMAGDSDGPVHDDGFMAAAPFLEPNIPMNVSGCVFPDGRITVRHPSIQLIGVPECTTREFGYAGNDFAALLEVVGAEHIAELERVTTETGRWLHARGYLGAFGIDAMVFGGKVYLTEVNPRFQGSSAAASSIVARTEIGDIYLDHLCAVLDLPVHAECPSLVEQAELQASRGRRLAQVVCYNTNGPVTLREGAIVPDLAVGDVRGVAEPGIKVSEEAMLFKLLVSGDATSTGFSISPEVSAAVTGLTASLYEPVTARG